MKILQEKYNQWIIDDIQIDFMFEYGKILDSTQDVIGIGFYLFYISYYKNNQINCFLYQAASLYLAHKIQEQERQIKSAVACFMYIIEQNTKFTNYQNDKCNNLNTRNLEEEEITSLFMEAEQNIISNIGFNFDIISPYQYLKYMEGIIAQNDNELQRENQQFLKTLGILINDSYRIPICIYHGPYLIFQSLLQVALKLKQKEFPYLECTQIEQNKLEEVNIIINEINLLYKRL